jgi:hypothetical protein
MTLNLSDTNMVYIFFPATHIKTQKEMFHFSILALLFDIGIITPNMTKSIINLHPQPFH